MNILEKERNPGGHAASFNIDGFTFDYGPHILFSKDKTILNFTYVNILNFMKK